MASQHMDAVQDPPQLTLEVERLTKTFDDGAVLAVDDVSFSVTHGEILAILGPSGCGKTTLMRMIAGLEFPDHGNILVNGRSVLGMQPHRRKIGLVFQDLAIFPHMSVYDNVAFGLRMEKYKKEDIRRRVYQILQMVELSPDVFAGRSSKMLSGGQKQRVAVARTLAKRPDIVLMDEPMGALDRKLRDRMTVELRRLLRRLETTVLYVTHDQESASFFADRILLMAEGRIVQSGSPIEIYRRPNSQFVADFIGTMNLIQATVAASDESGVVVRINGQELRMPGRRADSGAEVALGIRPENLEISREKSENSLARGRLIGWNFYNGVYYYQVQLEDGTELMISESSGRYTDVVDMEAWVEADMDAIVLLEE